MTSRQDDQVANSGGDSIDREVEILRRSAVMAPPGSRLPVLRELLLRLISRAGG